MTEQAINPVSNRLSPIFVFDVTQGRAVQISDSIDFRGPTGVSYRWLHLDLDDPGLQEWAAVNLPAVPAAALSQSETRPRCDAHGDGIILNLRAVNMNPGSDADDMVSLRLWIQGTSIVSVRRRKVFAIDALKGQCEAGNAAQTVCAFLVALVEGLTDRMEAVSLGLESAVDELEDKLLAGDFNFEKDLAMHRSSAAKLRRYIGPQRDAVSRLAGLETPIVQSHSKNALREIANRVTRIVEELDSIRERLNVINDSAEAQRGAAMSRNGYVLSIVAAIFLPLGFLTGLLGVNVAGIPGAQWPHSFAVLCGLTVVIGILLGILFKKMKWL